MSNNIDVGSILNVDKIYSGEDDEVLVCQAVRQETADVKSFIFRCERSRRFSFMPGQFLTFSFEIGGETVHRCYTISSPPTRPHTASITVKRVAGGIVSNWLHETMRPGLRVVASSPLGEFSASRHPAGKYLFLSAGSGITPLMSMLRSFFDLGIDTDIAFVHAAPTPDDIIFQKELSLIAQQSPMVSLAFICEKDSASTVVTGYRGRLSEAQFLLITPDFHEREILVCGPPGFLATAKEILRQRNFDMAHYHEESFDFESLSPAEHDAVEVAEKSTAALTEAQHGIVRRVEFSKSRRVIECPEDMTILDAARLAGLRLPSACTIGVCGTCKSKLISGSVAMEHKGGIRQKEIDAGMRLLCCSQPRSDLVIER